MKGTPPLRDDLAYAQLGQLLRCADAVERMAIPLGVTTRVTFDETTDKSADFPCVLDYYRRAYFVRNDSAGEFVYCANYGAGPEYTTLAAVYASRCKGDIWDIDRDGRVATGTWLTRLYDAAGLVSLPNVPLPPLHRDATLRERSFWLHVRWLFQCRWLVYPGCPIPLSQRLLGPWCGVSPTGAYHAVTALVARRVVWHVDDVGTKWGGRKMKVYLPWGYHPPPGWDPAGSPRHGDADGE